MKPRLTISAWLLIIVLVVLGLFLFNSVVSQVESGADYPPSETIVTTATGLLIKVVHCVSASSWVVLIDKRAKRWERTELREMDVEMGIASNIPNKSLIEHLHRLQILTYFDAITGQDDCDEQNRSIFASFIFSLPSSFLEFLPLVP